MKIPAEKSNISSGKLPEETRIYIIRYIIMDRKNLRILFIICLANSVIYTLPYLQSTYYDSMMAAYGFTHTEMGNLVGMYGMFNMGAYIFGGVAADVLDTKKLFVFSMLATGITGLYSATLPPYGQMLIISIFWSVSTILAFWPAMLKAVKLLAEGASRGRVFAFKEMLCCVLTFGLSMGALAVFNASGENFVLLVVFYSVCHLAIGLRVAVFMPSSPGSGKVNLKEIAVGVLQVTKLKGVWLVGMTIFFTQLAVIIFGRFTPFLTNITELSASFVAFITIISANGLANIGTFFGGKISDLMGSPAKFVACTLAACAAVTAVFLFIPWGAGTAAVCIGVYVLLRIINGATRSVIFATMNQIVIPSGLVGTAGGVISVIGYFPDIFGYTLCGRIMENLPAIAAYRVIFTGLILCCVAGCTVAMTLHRYSLKLKKV